MGDSHALRFARRVASGEAAQLGHSRIEIEHLLIGLCKLEDQQAWAFLEQLRLSPQDLAEAQQEIDALLGIFTQLQLNPARLRRRLRSQLGDQQAVPTLSAAQRVTYAAGAQAAIAEAERIARGARAPAAGIVHLLAAISAAPSPMVSALLDEAGVSIAELRRLAGASSAQRTTERSGGISYSVAATEPPFSASGHGAAGAAERAIDWLQAFYRIAQAIAAALGDELYGVIARELRSVLPQATSGAILTVASSGELQKRVSWPTDLFSRNKKWAERAMEEGSSFIWSAQAPARRGTTSGGLQAAMYAPLICADKVLGVLYVENQERADAFAPCDLDMVRAIASQAAIAVFNQSLRREQDQLAVARANLSRHFPAPLVERLTTYFSAPAAKPQWADHGAVLAVRMHPPPGLAAGERVLRQSGLELALTHNLLSRGASVSRSNTGTILLAIFDSAATDASCAALQAGWALVRQQRSTGWALSAGLEYGELVQQLIAAEVADTELWQHNLFEPYERGMRELLGQITTTDHPGLGELLIYQTRLEENIRYARLHGDHEARRAERHEILGLLNDWSRQYLHVPFNTLCEKRDGFEGVLMPEYRAAGVAVEVALRLAANTAPEALLLGPEAHARLADACVASRLPDRSSYIVTALP